jgi:rRNA maturation protein Rpf1
VIVTTSRYASTGTRAAAKKMAVEMRGRYAARCKKTIQELADYSWKQGHSKLFVVEEKKGKPAFLSEIIIDSWGKWKWGERNEIKGKHATSVRKRKGSS